MLDDESQESHESDLDKEYIIPRSESRGTSQCSLRYNDDQSSDAMHYDIDETCRICLNTGTVPIFGTDDLSADIKHFASINISTDDGMPQCICSACWEMLAMAVTFRKNAQNTDNILRKMSASECENQSESESKCDYGPYVIRNDPTDTAADEIMEDKSSDEEHSEIGVYLECHNTAESSDGESQISTENFNKGNDTASMPDTEQDPKELEYLLKDLKSNKRNLRCQICLISFRTLEQIDEHSAKHDPMDIRRCEVCQNIIHKSLYDIHIKVHREAYNERRNTKYAKVNCTVCQKLVSKTYLKEHMKLHGPDEVKQGRYQTCNICDTPISKKYLVSHIKCKHLKQDVDESTQIPKQMCPICFQMIKQSYYKEHVSGHALKQRKLICEECGKEFIHSSSFKTHILTHKSEYKFQCQFCPYQAKHVGLLKIHVRTHTKDYPYKCTTCDKNFITKSNLSAHQRNQHSNRVRFVCSECGQSFAQANTLLCHHKTVHLNIKDFKCDICGRAYGKKETLIVHLKKVHGLQFKSQVGRTPSYIAEKIKAREEGLN